MGALPILMRLHSAQLQFDDVQEAGNDIRFVAADDKTPLKFHLESFDPLLGVALIWVDVSGLRRGRSKDIWLYYGNAKAPPGGESGGDLRSRLHAGLSFRRRRRVPAPGCHCLPQQHRRARRAGPERDRRQGRTLCRLRRDHGPGHLVAGHSGGRRIHLRGLGQAGREPAQRRRLRPAQWRRRSIVGLDSGNPFAEVRRRYAGARRRDAGHSQRAVAATSPSPRATTS